VATRQAAGATCDAVGVECLVTAVADVFAASFTTSFDPTVASYSGHSLAGSLLSSDGALVAVLEDVQVTLFGRKGWELKLAGDEGTIDTDKRDFVLAKRNGVIAVQLESGYIIYTNHLAWVDADRQISTRDPVQITGHGLEITGHGFVGKLDKEEFKVLEDVHVAIIQ